MAEVGSSYRLINFTPFKRRGIFLAGGGGVEREIFLYLFLQFQRDEWKCGRGSGRASKGIRNYRAGLSARCR